ncbi:MAG: AAA family ATPase [Bacteroidales bacterium]|nr:AAA family ATPase [Bacteroidales bacterium]
MLFTISESATHSNLPSVDYHPFTPAGFFGKLYKIFKIKHSKFNIQHSKFKIQHSKFSIQNSTFSIQHSTFNIQNSTFNIQHSTFSLQNSTYLNLLMNKTDLSTLILKHFSHSPTSGQALLIDKLANFILSQDYNSAFILKGYAGTGKTSIMSALIKSLPLFRPANSGTLRSVLLAPTGRAAKVLSNYSDKKAYTIHKKIYKIKQTKQGATFLILQKNPHKDTIFIIDEASMIQAEKKTDNSFFGERNLLEDLVSYLNSGERCRCIFIGDTAQLPPVALQISPALDPSYITGLYFNSVIDFELTEVVRQSLNSGILANATYLRQKIHKNDYKAPLFYIKKYQDIISISPSELEDALRSEYSVNGSENCVVICRSNKLANKFNQQIRSHILNRENEIATGDYLMVLKNNYFWLPDESPAGFIANGDIIEIIKIRKITDLYGYRFAEAVIRLIDFPDEGELNVNLMLNTINLETPALPATDETNFFYEVMKDYEDLQNKKDKILAVKKNPWFNALQVKFAYSLTCHKTQGGQWDIVFVYQAFSSPDNIDKEYLRWLYTALTRSVKKTYLINFNNDFFIQQINR